MALDAEAVRLMTNWAMWRSGSKTGVAVSGAYELEARGLRAETSMPLIDGDAVEIEYAVQLLEAHHRQAIEEHWLKAGTVEMKARRCSCSVGTLYRRVDRGHERIQVIRREQREKSERQRLAYHSHSENRIRR